MDDGIRVRLIVRDVHVDRVRAELAKVLGLLLSAGETILARHSEDDDPRAIVICKGGQGVAIAANRVRGIRAVVIDNVEEAKMARIDNNSNVLCLPARTLENDEAKTFDIVDTWLKTPFSGAERHVRRLRDHEAIHQHMALEGGRELLRRLGALVAPDCASLEQEAQELVSSLQASHQEEHRRFDLASEYGRRPSP